MDDEFVAMAEKIADEAARCSIALGDARRLLAEAVEYADVEAAHPQWCHAVNRLLRTAS